MSVSPTQRRYQSMHASGARMAAATMPEFDHAGHYRAYDKTLGKWFRAPSQEALLRLMNDPMWVDARNAKHREYAVAAYQQHIYGSGDCVLNAIQKRERKQQKRLQHRQEQAA